MGTVGEWQIHNFSCWYYDMHGALISDWILKDHFLRLDLFPTDRKSGHLVAVCVGPQVASDLKILAPDGSLLFEQKLNSWDSATGDLDVARLTQGPKLEDVLARIRQCEARHGDRITFRFACEESITPKTVAVHSKVEVIERTLKVSLSQLREGAGSCCVATMYYPSREDITEEMRLIINDKYGTGLLFIKLDPTDHPVVVRVRNSLLDKEGSVIRTEVKENFFWWKEDWTFSNSLWLHEARRMQLSLLLHFTIVPFLHVPRKNEGHRSTTMIVTEVPRESVIPVPDLVRDFKCLIDIKERADCEIRCEGASVPIHRNVLSVRSPVLRERIKESGSVVIEEFDPLTLRLFVDYLYKGAFEGTTLQWESAVKLYSVADKYQVPDLKKACADFLSANVSNVNVERIRQLGLTHGDFQLDLAAFEFLSTHQKWKTLSSGPLTSLAKCVYQKCITEILDHREVCQEEICWASSVVTADEIEKTVDIIKMDPGSQLENELSHDEGFKERMLRMLGGIMVKTKTWEEHIKNKKSWLDEEKLQSLLSFMLDTVLTNLLFPAHDS